MQKEPVVTERATIWQVAEAAGVSHQTVSRFLRADPGMKPQTQEKVRRAISDLDYTPNLLARSLRTRRIQRIAVLLPSDSGAQAATLSGAIDVAHAEGYTLEVFSTEGDAHARFERVLEMADSGRVDGIMALAPLPPETENRYPGRAAVVVSADYDERSRAIGELADGSAISLLIEGLVEAGHRRFLHVTGDLSFASARNRRDVFVATIERLDLGPPLVHVGAWKAAAGHEAVLAMSPTDHPTALIAASDPIAAGAIEGARQRGWHVPGDLSITGWDDETLGAHLQPTLTTVDIDRRRLGRNVMCRLIATLRSEPLADEESLATVIWRGSTGPVPK